MNMNQKLTAIRDFARAHGWYAELTSNEDGYEMVKVRLVDHHFCHNTDNEGFVTVYTMTDLLSRMNNRNEDGTEI